jgi:hypothetical protein
MSQVRASRGVCPTPHCPQTHTTATPHCHGAQMIALEPREGLGEGAGPVGNYDDGDTAETTVGFAWPEIQTEREYVEEVALFRIEKHRRFLAAVRAAVCVPQSVSTSTSPLARESLRASAINPNGDNWRCGRGGADTMMDSAIIFEDARLTLSSSKRKAVAPIEDGGSDDAEATRPCHWSKVHRHL